MQVAKGTVKWFNDEKGFGFILPEEGGKDIFVHRSNVDTPTRSLQDGQAVTFEIGQGRKGPEAMSVRPA
jgi:CspA family cold shock protein